ncbi:MAG: leucine zipper domain-containing protein [Nostoc sp.]|uniref:leucine zipper domain-containing protein n=1 Tax=Nostoc sp. TaxID=1180 RepID=UPI002FFB8AC9
MTPEEIASTLTELFDTSAVGALAQPVVDIAPGSWQVDTSTFRLLVLLSEDNTWLRVLLPIVPAESGQPFLEQFLEANFDDTQEVRYAFYEGVIWGVFQHNSGTLVSADLSNAINRLVSLYEARLDNVFNRLIESRIRQIIQAAKQQGQSLQATMQSLERFYAEGLMGDINQTSEAREEVLTTWRRQLERLWNEVDFNS